MSEPKSRIAAPMPTRLPARPVITSLPTSIALFIGAAATGPVNSAVKVASNADFQRGFGSPDATHALGCSVGQYFVNGGRTAWVISLGALDATTLSQALLQCFVPGGAVDAIDRFDLLCVPGLSDPVTQVALQAQCAARRAFYIADCDATATATVLAQGPDPSLLGNDASCSALYAPWVMAVDPSTQTIRAFPPSGFVAGIYARIDAALGVWKAPAGSAANLIGATGLALAIDDTLGNAMNLAGIDVLRTFQAGPVVWGARTLAGASASAGDGTYRYVPVRRLLSTIEVSLEHGLAWVASAANTAATWTQVSQAANDYLLTLFRQGALTGSTPQAAFVVRCDASTTTPADIAAGHVVLVVGVAPSRPSEFVVLRIVLRAGT